MHQGAANRREGDADVKRAGRTKRSNDPAANRLEALRWLRLAIVLAALLPLLFFAAAAYTDYQAAYRSAQTRSERAAQIAHEQASRVFEINEVIARQLLHTLGVPDGDRADVGEPACTRSCAVWPTGSPTAARSPSGTPRAGRW